MKDKTMAWRPFGVGMLLSASGDIAIGQFGVPISQVQPNLEQGFVLWRMESLIVIREKSPGLSWKTGLVPVEIYCNRKPLEAIDWAASWQLNQMSDLVEAICVEHTNSFVMSSISAEHWGDAPRFSGCIQQVTVAAECLNTGIQPKKLQGKKEDQLQVDLLSLLSSMQFSREMSLQVLIPGMSLEVKSVCVYTEDGWKYEGSMNRGRAVNGTLSKPGAKKAFFVGVFDLDTGEPSFQKGDKSRKKYTPGDATAATFFAL